MCEKCLEPFAQRFGRGRPRKYCGSQCEDAAKAEKDRLRQQGNRTTRFGTVEAYHAYQRSPARRAELSRKLREHHAAVGRVVDSCRSVADLIEEFGGDDA